MQVSDELITLVYDVCDLVLPIRTPEFSETGEQQQAKKANADFDTLVELIQSTIAPDSWDEVGGRGSMAPFESNLSLVVSQTQGVQEQIVDLLAQLRRLQEAKIILHATTFELTTNLTKKLGLHGKRLAVLTAREQELILSAANRDPRARVFPDLKGTLYNGQVMPMRVEDDLVLFIQGVLATDKSIRVQADLAKPESASGMSSAVLSGDETLLVRMPSIAESPEKMLFRLITAEAAKQDDKSARK